MAAPDPDGGERAGRHVSPADASEMGPVMSGAGVDDGGWQAAQAMSSGAVRRVMETDSSLPYSTG